ncbi:MAG: molybdopterin-dependent oxidoreductase [Verrucomicrobia bacterium]|nr:molybdopterin-dependent oxidoreductase [Verrucomicrobiota bacterium]
MPDPQHVEPPKLQMVNLTIDDQPVSVPRGANVILAARKLGIQIPHYCYHEKLSVSGNCRMCLIEMGTPRMGPDRKPVLKPDGTPEIAWIPRPQIGCATTVSEGMAVRTRSKMVEDARKGVLEFLLINHPLDCPVCDQAGECHLQEYSVEYGNGQSRFIEQKVHKPKNVRLGPRVTLDDERCILCSRCIRFCREIAKDDVLGFLDRGSHTTLGSYPGRQLENNYSLNTTDICPVGALTSTDFRFKMRAWFLKETESICTSCATGCNIIVGSREGVVHRYTPRGNDAVNSDWMCDAGRLNYKWINDERRLQTPMLRSNTIAASGSDVAPVTWEVALEFCRQKLQDSRGRLAVLASGRCSTEELFLLKKIAATYLAQATDIVGRTGDGDRLLLSADKNPNTEGARLMGLTGERPGESIPKIREGIARGDIRGLLAVGECAVKMGVPASSLDKLDALIVIDVLPNGATAWAQAALPGAVHVEKRGTFINGKKRLQRFHPAFPPKGQARADWEILRGLLPETVTRDLTTFERLFKEMCDQTPALNGLSWNAVGDCGVDLR